MNCQRAREFFADLLDPRASATASADLAAAKAHLANCPDCQREFAALSQTLLALDQLPTPAPSVQLRRNFYAMLEEEKHSAASVRAVAEREQRARHARLRRWILLPLGACALLAAGFNLGTRFQPASGPTPEPNAVANAELKRELHELRSKIDRIESMNQLVAAVFQQQSRSANERMNGVLTSAAQANPSEPVINELITSLALDPSANVRLRALEALYPHANRETVRAGVLASLSRESNPLVQVQMIDFLAAARDRDAKPTLERLAVSDAIDSNVREAAKRAVAQL